MTRARTVLAGDVGGTKTLLGLFRADHGRLEPLRIDRYASAEHDGLESMLRAFLGPERIRVDAAAFGVAGPVVDGRSRFSNLPWVLEEQSLRGRLPRTRVALVNDLEALAWGLDALQGAQVARLARRAPAAQANRAIIAAGTGLGMALMVWDGTRHTPSASEGGHQGFAPRDELEVDLLRFLWARHGRVSLDRVLSGSGLRAIYEFLTESGRARTTRALRRRIESAADPNAEVSRAALAGDDGAARAALERFVEIYGAAAGDLALVAHATGGLWVAGGIAPRILPALRTGGFVRAFLDKGRLRPLVERVPLAVVREPRAGLLGAAHRAAALLAA